MGNLVLAVLAFALVSSVGAGVAVHQTMVAPHNGDVCGPDHSDTGEKETGERNEAGDHNGTRDHNETGEHNLTGDNDNETADHDDNGPCEPNGDNHDVDDSDLNETKDEG